MGVADILGQHLLIRTIIADPKQVNHKHPDLTKLVGDLDDSLDLLWAKCKHLERIQEAAQQMTSQ